MIFICGIHHGMNGMPDYSDFPGSSGCLRQRDMLRRSGCTG